MAEATCGDCFRTVFDGTDIYEFGWVTRCGRRIARIEQCDTLACERDGGHTFDVDGALLTPKAPDIILAPTGSFQD